MSTLLDVSMQRINTLNTKLIPSATRVFERCHKEKIPVYVVWGSRTVEQQDVLFRLGRTAPGPLQTTKRGGYSAHNYGLALDFCLLFQWSIDELGRLLSTRLLAQQVVKGSEVF